MTKKLFGLLFIFNSMVLIFLSSWIFFGSLQQSEKLADESYKSMEPDVSIITAIDFDTSQCRDENGQPTNNYWCVATVTNPNPDYWIQGKGKFMILNKNGDTIGGFSFSDMILASKAQSWLVPSNLLHQHYSYSIKGEIDSYKLILEDVKWIQVIKSDEHYQWNSTIETHSINGMQYPKHSLTIRVSNTGDSVMFRTKIFALIYNSKDELVDITWSEEPGDWPTGTMISPGENKTISVNSLAQSGVCLGKIDPKEYHIKYWVDVLTSSGQPFQTFHSETILATDTIKSP